MPNLTVQLLCDKDNKGDNECEVKTEEERAPFNVERSWDLAEWNGLPEKNCARALTSPDSETPSRFSVSLATKSLERNRFGSIEFLARGGGDTICRFSKSKEAWTSSGLRRTVVRRTGEAGYSG